MEVCLTESLKNFFKDDLEQFEIKLEEISRRNIDIPSIVIQIKRCCYQILEKNLWQLSYKVFTYEFHKFREENNFPINKGSSVAYNHYVSQFNETTISVWFEKYPVYYELIKNSVKNLLEYLTDVINNYYKDYTLLEDAFLSKNTRIEQVYPMDSDPHNGGRIVLCFVDSNSQRIIYKPRSLTVDKLVREIFQDALNIENTLGFIPVPLSLDCEGYGWQEYIEKSHVNHCELDKSYFNLGYCSAVFSCLGAVDLHDENIIFNKNRPYFIDLETVFQPANKRVIKNLVDTVNEMLLNSIVTTTIMPSKLSVFPHDILIGGINTLFPQETNEKVFRLKDFGTDGMDIVKETIKSTKQSTSFLFDSARDIRPLEFQTEFIAGYEKGYYKVLQSKNQIKRVVSEGDCILRVVLRPTTQYYLLIDACLYPENLTSLESINNNVLNYIKSSKIFTSDLDTQNIISEEKDMLISGDIPYFYIKYDSNYLETFSGFQSRCFEMSPKENLLNRLDKSSEKQLSLDKRFIAEGFSYIRMVESRFRNDLKNTEKNSPLFNKLLDSLESLDTNYMIDFLLENSIKTKNEEKMGWLTGIYGNTTLSYNSIMQVSFFDSAGILFVFEHIKNKKYTKKIISAFSELQKILDSNENGSSDSIISGKNSLLFLKGYKDQRIPEMEESLISNKSNLYANDLFLQPIGVSHVLSTFSCSNFELMKSQLKSIDYVNSDFKKFGIAHGKLGIKWAEFRLNQKLNNFEQSDLIFQSVLEMMAEVKKVENGWCNGSSGLLMVLYEMARRLNKRIDLFEFARNCTEIDDYDDYLEIDLSVCHGVAGKVQSLLFVYAITDDKRFLDLANKYWKKVFVIAKKNGYYTGEKSRDYLLGYFLGWSGIIDTAILL
ncbi:TPA: DUF4135 domain-containing protein, partial [Streptococcus suis]